MIHKTPVMLLIDDTQDTDDADDNDDGMLINNVDAKAGRVTGRVALPTGPASKLFSVYVYEEYDHSQCEYKKIHGEIPKKSLRNSTCQRDQHQSCVCL